MHEVERYKYTNHNDIIEQKIIERMGHISSELAHDLRSPLQTIQNAVYLLERDPYNEQLYNIIRQSLTKTTQILDDFRDYYNAHIIQLIDIDPAKVIDLALSDLDMPLNIKLSKEIDEVGSISIDHSKMVLALKKLIVNAIEAMPEGGELVIKLLEDGGSVKIIISDSGVGINSEMSGIIYTPFISNRKKGIGLGVPTAKRIVESHGGVLSFTSKVGVGTVFTISLPFSFY